jgi:hypothetical protein
VLPDDLSSNVVALSDAFRDDTSAGSGGFCGGADAVGRRGTCSTTYLNWNMPSLEKQSKKE